MGPDVLDQATAALATIDSALTGNLTALREARADLLLDRVFPLNEHADAVLELWDDCWMWSAALVPEGGGWQLPGSLEADERVSLPFRVGGATCQYWRDYVSATLGADLAEFYFGAGGAVARGVRS